MKIYRRATLNKAVKIIRNSILSLCAVVIVVCLFLLGKAVVGYIQADNAYSDINSGMNSVDDTVEAPERIKALMEAYKEMKAQYPDMVGYINMPSVSICYPVMQSDDNVYYLTRLPDGSDSASGSVFLDFATESNPMSEKNLVLYGHNMNNGSMFHNVEALFKEDAFKDCRFEYICDAGVFVYESLSVYMTSIRDNFYRTYFADNEEFLAFCSDRAGMSRIPAEAVYGDNTSIITLVTCTNSVWTNDNRFVYHGYLVEQYTDFGEMK